MKKPVSLNTLRMRKAVDGPAENISIPDMLRWLADEIENGEISHDCLLILGLHENNGRTSISYYRCGAIDIYRESYLLHYALVEACSDNGK